MTYFNVREAHVQKHRLTRKLNNNYTFNNNKINFRINFETSNNRTCASAALIQSILENWS